MSDPVEAALREWWESLSYEEKWEAFVIEKHNAEAAIRSESAGTLDVEAFAQAVFNVDNPDESRLVDDEDRAWAARYLIEYARLSSSDTGLHNLGDGPGRPSASRSVADRVQTGPSLSARLSSSDTER